MQLEKLAISLRPRHPNEAIDLGIRMAMHWSKSLYSLVLPSAADHYYSVRAGALDGHWLLGHQRRYLVDKAAVGQNGRFRYGAHCLW